MEKNKRNGIKHLMALMLFFMVLSAGMVSLADVKGTVIAKSAVIRASADPNSAKLASVPSGKVIDIISKTSGTDNNTWYQVYVNSDTKGFIRSDLIKVPDGADIPNTQGGAATAPSADTTPTTATPVDAKQVSVISNNTNIRESASTNSASKAKANRGMILTVVGEADGSDGKKWYQVTFTYNNEEKSGYVRSDLVTTDNVPNDPATTQITGEVPGEEQPPAETAPAEEPPAAEPPVETPQPENNSVIPMNVDEVPYIMPGFELITLSADGQGYNAYKNGAFLIFYGQKANGEQGWYLFDSENHIYQRYVYTTDGITPPDDGFGALGLIPVIILVVIIVILVSVVGLLLIRLKGQGTGYKRYKSYDDDDDDQDDDIEDLEDMEEDDDDDDEPLPARRPQSQQAVRRPQGAPSGSAPQGQPPRRPQGQQPPRHPQSQQPPRRPQGALSNSAPQGGANGQPPRRSQGGNAPGSGGARPQGGQPARRPQGGVNGQPPRRPQPQNDRVPGEKGQARGYKAKNLLDDEDMDFMDIE